MPRCCRRGRPGLHPRADVVAGLTGPGLAGKPAWRRRPLARLPALSAMRALRSFRPVDAVTRRGSSPALALALDGAQPRSSGRKERRSLTFQLQRISVAVRTGLRAADHRPYRAGAGDRALPGRSQPAQPFATVRLANARRGRLASGVAERPYKRLAATRPHLFGDSPWGRSCRANSACCPFAVDTKVMTNAASECGADIATGYISGGVRAAPPASTRPQTTTIASRPPRSGAALAIEHPARGLAAGDPDDARRGRVPNAFRLTQAPQWARTTSIAVCSAARE